MSGQDSIKARESAKTFCFNPFTTNKNADINQPHPHIITQVNEKWDIKVHNIIECRI